MFAVGVVGGERSRSDVFGYPLRVAGTTVEGRGCGECWMKVGNRAWKAVLEETIRVNRRDNVLEARRVGRSRRSGCRHRCGWKGPFF